ncbi:hypothetical protein RKD37_003538 [Streptomyces ambofaciens]
MAQRLDRVEQRGLAGRLRLLLQEHRDAQEADRHQERGAEERVAPAGVAEQRAQQRAAGHAEAEGGFVEQDRRGAPAGRRADDHREGRGDEQRVAQAPAGPVADELADGVGGAGEAREDHDEGQAEQQGLAAADAAGDEAGDQHRQGGDEEVRGEQEGDLTGARVQALGDGRKDRVDEPDAHEGHHGGARGRPHGLGLPQDAARTRVEGVHACSPMPRN